MPKYYDLWTKYLPHIYLYVDKSIYSKERKFIQLNQHEFEEIGQRYSSGYTFNLEIQNGKVINNISGTIVARDLFDILSQDAQQQEWLLHKKIKISLNKDIILSITAFNRE